MKQNFYNVSSFDRCFYFNNFFNFVILAAVSDDPEKQTVAIDGINAEDSDALLAWITKNKAAIDATNFGSTSAIELYVRESYQATLPPAWQINQLKLDDLLVLETKHIPIHGLVFQQNFNEIQ